MLGTPRAVQWSSKRAGTTARRCRSTGAVSLAVSTTWQALLELNLALHRLLCAGGRGRRRGTLQKCVQWSGKWLLVRQCSLVCVPWALSARVLCVAIIRPGCGNV